MGKKGAKLTSVSNKAAEELLDLLHSIDGISSKKMFGGNGIFHDSKMFGIINSKGICFFKVNEKTKSDYEEKESNKHARMPYYSVPEEILVEEEQLIIWARKSIEISKE